MISRKQINPQIEEDAGTRGLLDAGNLQLGIHTPPDQRRPFLRFGRGLKPSRPQAETLATPRVTASPHRRVFFGQSGFTIIESLVAIAVLGILMSAIAPVIILSVANRVQARRVELAVQAAKAFVDGVRAGAIAAPDHTIPHQVTLTSSEAFEPKRNNLANVKGPKSSGSLSCTADTYCQTPSTASLYCVDLDDTKGCSSNSPKDLVIQAFRSVTPNSTDAQKGYLLAFRVYRADAFSDNTSLKPQNPNEIGIKQATFTGGQGDRKAPLVEMTTEIVTDKTTFRDFCDRLGGCQ